MTYHFEFGDKKINIIYIYIRVSQVADSMQLRCFTCNCCVHAVFIVLEHMYHNQPLCHTELPHRSHLHIEEPKEDL